MKLYSVKDKVGEEFGPLFPAKNDAVARRAFLLEVPVEFKQNIQDYELYCVGEFDKDTGDLIGYLPLLISWEQKVDEEVVNESV